MNYFLKKNKGAYFYYVDKILDFGKYPKVFFRAKYNLPLQKGSTNVKRLG